MRGGPISIISQKKKFMKTVEIKSLHVYPVKSLGAIDLEEAIIHERGFAYDRNWMIVEPDGSKLTQRELPMMALIKPKLEPDLLVLNYKDFASLEVSLDCYPKDKLSVDIWGHKCVALDEGPRAAEWLSNILRKEVRLVRFDPDHIRHVDSTWAGTSGAHTGFADVLPFLITSEESLALLNEYRHAEGLQPSPMTRFRPNIVISGIEAFGEDNIPALKLPYSEGKIELVRPCSRCPITNTDQVTGEKEKRGNLQILAERRNLRNYKGKPGAMFGVQAFPSNADRQRVSVGDMLEITELSDGLPPLPRVS